MPLPANDLLDADPVRGDLSGGLSTVATERQARIEGTDAPASTATPYTMAPGDSFIGQLNSDTDWVRVTLRAGTTYVIDLTGHNAYPVSDPWLALRDSGGLLIASDDDSGAGLNSRVTFTATSSGTYYLDAGTYGTYGSGGYRLSIAEVGELPVDDIASFLSDGYWEGTGRARRAFELPQDGVLTVDISGLTAAGQRLAIDALGVWTATTGIRFRTQTGGAAITFDDSDEGAYSTSSVSGGRILDSFVNVSTQWLASYGTGLSSYSFQTYIHEIGHALGLGHAGNYNGSADWGWDNVFEADSWQATVMSYFSQDDNPSVPGTYAYLLTPMVADVIAMRALYGEVGLLRAGDNSYGTTSNAGGIYAAAATLLRGGTADGIAFTVVDEGGTDTLDFSLAATRVEIDLRQGSHSSAGGEVDNISIAIGTVIERAIGGAGHDLIRGNAVANVLMGQAGNDRLQGDGGNDTLVGGLGRDTLTGGAGDDLFHWGVGDVIVEGTGGGTDTVLSGATHQLALGVENLSQTGTAAVTGLGNSLANRLIGNAAANRLVGGRGNDTLNGLGGNDRLEGGGGDDTYVWAPGDTVIEVAAAGFDTLSTATTVVLGAHMERLVLTGSAAINGFGNELDNVLAGNAAANRLGGGLGNDTLTGGGGADTFLFAAGADWFRDMADNVDTLAFSRALLGGQASVAAVLAHGSITAQGAVFAFDGGHRLIVSGISALSQLADDIVFF